MERKRGEERGRKGEEGEERKGEGGREGEERKGRRGREIGGEREGGRLT